MRDMTGGEEEGEEEEYVADCADEEDNEVEEEDEEDAVATTIGVQVARRKPRDRKSERVGRQEELDLSDSLCRLLRWWLPQPINRAMVNVCVGEFKNVICEAIYFDGGDRDTCRS
jgi:hypothetical protein